MKNFIEQNKTPQYYESYDKFYFITTKIIGFINRYLYPVRRSELTFMLAHISDENLKVLDYGCGSGFFAARIKRERPSCDVHATDINPYAIESGCKKYIDIKFRELNG